MICLANNLLRFHFWKLNFKTEERLYTWKTYENCIAKIIGSLAKHILVNLISWNVLMRKFKKQVEFKCNQKT